MMAVGGQNQKHARKRAVEMPGLWESGKPKTGFPPPRIPYLREPKTGRRALRAALRVKE